MLTAIPRLTMSLATIVLALALLVACGGDTPAPSPGAEPVVIPTVIPAATPEPTRAPDPAPAPETTATPAATPVATPAATLAATPTAAPTAAPAEPAESGVAAYVEACDAEVSAIVSSIDMLDEGDDVTWGEWAEEVDAWLGAYDQLSPPQELQELHDANLRVYEGLRDHARTRPSEDSFIEEFLGMSAEMIGLAFEIDLDTTKTDEEKERLIEERAGEVVGELFGPDFAATSQAAEEALEALADETLALLEDSECYSDFFEEDEGISPPVDAGAGLAEATPVTVGESVQGLLDDDERDTFVFQAEEGMFYQIGVELGTLEDSTLELLDADGWMLEYNDDSGDSLASRIVWRAESSGEYYVAVGGWDTGSYTMTVVVLDIEDDHGDDVDNATAVTVGEAAQGNMDYDGDLDFFAFEAQEGVVYQIDVELGTLEDSGVELVDADGWVLEFNVDFESLASRIVWRAESSGEYYVAVSGWGTGSYTMTVAVLDIEDDHGDDIDGATAMTVGEAAQGNMDYDGDLDFFVIEAQEGVLYQIDVDLGTLDDSTLELLDADGWQLRYNDDHGDSPASRIVGTAPRSDKYYAAVGGYGTGSYTLTVTVSDIEDDHGYGFGSATAVTMGEALGGVIDYEGDNDFFRFTAAAGQIYRIDVELGTLEDSWAALLDADEWELGYNDDFGDSLASRIVWMAESAGEYYVAVSGYVTGSYTLTVTVLDIEDDHGNGFGSATAVTVGESVGGVIDYEGDYDYFRFTAAAGQTYRIDVELGTLEDSWVELLDADEWELEYNDDFGDSLASRMVWEATESGDYYVVVGSFQGTGSYTISVILVP